MHARVGEFERRQRLAARRPRSRVDLGGADRAARSRRGRRDRSAANIGERLVAARAHVVDDGGDGGVDVGRRLRAWRQQRARSAARSPSAPMSSSIAIDNLSSALASDRRRRPSARVRRTPPRGGASPMSRSSASRHSTSSRTSAPSAKASMTMPDGRIGLLEGDRQQVERRVLVAGRRGRGAKPSAPDRSAARSRRAPPAPSSRRPSRSACRRATKRFCFGQPGHVGAAARRCSGHAPRSRRALRGRARWSLSSVADAGIALSPTIRVDVGAAGAELCFETLEAAIEMIDAVDGGFAFAPRARR